MLTCARCTFNIPQATGTLYPECSAGAVKCCTSFNCSLAKAPLCAADAFPEAIAKVFDPEWSVRLLSNQTTTTNNHHLERGTDDTGTGGVETAAVPQCLYYFGLNYVPFEKSVAAVGAFLVEWVKEHAYDGVYLDEYFSAEVFERVFTRAGSGLFAGKGNHYDTDGDGRADSLDQIQVSTRVERACSSESSDSTCPHSFNHVGETHKENNT